MMSNPYNITVCNYTWEPLVQDQSGNMGMNTINLYGAGKAVNLQN